MTGSLTDHSAATARHTPLTVAELALRAGRPEEAAALSALALRSKAFWGYSASFMAAVTPELTLTEDQAAGAVVAQVDGEIGGFHLLGPTRGRSAGTEPESAAAELDMLFVDPQFIGTGLGRVLYEDARARAVAQGYRRMLIEADPHSLTFYLRLGAVEVGERLSRAIPGRSLPLLEVTLRTSGGGSVGAGRASYWR